MSTHAAQSTHAQGIDPFGVITSARTAPATTRSQLHAELRDTAGAIPIPLNPASATDPAVTADEVDGKKIQAITAVGTQHLREPTLPELMWLGEMRLHLHHPADPAPTITELSTRFDDFCESWHSGVPNDRWDCTYAVASLGVGLGDLLVKHLPGARWTMYQNDQTPTFAVRDEEQRVTYLPLDSVARRWHGRQLDWIQTFLDQAVGPDKTGQVMPPATAQ